MESILLQNGVKIIYDSIETVDTVAVGIFINVGSKHEKIEDAGITHFIEHMILRSNQYFKDKEAIEIIENLGGIVNAFTTKEYMCLYSKSLKENTRQVVEILFKMLFYPIFKVEEIQIEQKVVLNEINRYKENKYELAHQQLLEIMFGEHPLARNILGEINTLNHFTKEKIEQYFNEVFIKKKIVVSLSGNITSELKEYIEELFQSLEPRAENNIHLEDLTIRFGEKIISNQDRVLQHYLCIGFPTYSYKNPKFFASILFNHILGAGNNSTLLKYLRNEFGLVYSAGSTQYIYREGGVLTINISSSVMNDIHYIQEVVMDLLNSRYELSLDSLFIAKHQLKSKMIFALESSTTRMLDYGKNAILDLDNSEILPINYNDINRNIEIIDKLTVEEVKNIHMEIKNTAPSISIVTTK
jgi:predicted Zn-dependent peptidase